MAATRVLRCYGEGHLALVGTDQPRIDIDPRLPDEDGRDDALAALDTSFVLLTQASRAGVDDALDVLEAHGDAVLVATPALCDRLDRELDLDDRLVDLADWDRVGFAGLHLTGLPQPRGGLPGVEVLPGADRLPDPTGVLADATETLERALSGVPLLGSVAAQATGLGNVLGGGHRRALFLALDGGPGVLLAGDCLAGAPPRRWLEDLAEELEVDVLVAAAAGDRVDGLVRAVRELAPKKVVLYRDRDPYDGRGQGLPMARFVEALDEDQPEVEVVHLRAGQELDLG